MQLDPLFQAAVYRPHPPLQLQFINQVCQRARPSLKEILLKKQKQQRDGDSKRLVGELKKLFDNADDSTMVGLALSNKTKTFDNLPGDLWHCFQLIEDPENSGMACLEIWISKKQWINERPKPTQQSYPKPHRNQGVLRSVEEAFLNSTKIGYRPRLAGSEITFMDRPDYESMWSAEQWRKKKEGKFWTKSKTGAKWFAIERASFNYNWPQMPQYVLGAGADWQGLPKFPAKTKLKKDTPFKRQQQRKVEC